jgi:uncharacterized damage-inducible protein DinB
MSSGFVVLTCLCACALAADVRAQTQGSPITAGAVRLSEFVKGNIIKSAEQMPEEHYTFRPTPEVRTFSAILGHVANTNYQNCSQAASEKNPSKTDVEKTVTMKAALVDALRESFAYCDQILGRMNDRFGSELVTYPGGDLPRLSVIAVNTAHNFEHYGNLITYLRMKGLVPPSSQPK